MWTKQERAKSETPKPLAEMKYPWPLQIDSVKIIQRFIFVVSLNILSTFFDLVESEAMHFQPIEIQL